MIETSLWTLEALLAPVGPTTSAAKAARFLPRIVRPVMRQFRRQRVVITGLSGVGKTALARTLCGRDPGPSQNTDARAPSNGTERLILREIPDKPRAIVLPGDESAPKILALDHAFQNGIPDGIIYVAANGYSTPRAGYGALVEEHTDLPSSLEEHREAQLRAEEDDLARLVEHVRHGSRADPKPFWFLMAVNKIDLYVDQLADDVAERYVGDGDMGHRVRELMSWVGRDRIRAAARPIVAEPSPFEFQNSTVDPALEPEQIETLRNRFTTLLGTMRNALRETPAS